MGRRGLQYSFTFSGTDGSASDFKVYNVDSNVSLSNESFVCEISLQPVPGTFSSGVNLPGLDSAQ